MRLMAMAGSAQAAAGRDGGASSRYGAGRRSPLGLGGTVAVHALVVGAFLLIPKQVIEHLSLKKGRVADPVRAVYTRLRLWCKRFAAGFHRFLLSG